ncbi:hypothetical protein MMC11_003231 [Xylographa trunciseda]|nr:hypothetical protein [Xylographa trunciseda]
MTCAPYRIAALTKIRRHIAKALGQYSCPQPGCIIRSGTKGDLQRHLQERHKQGKNGQPAMLYLCKYKECNRSLDGFARSWNLTQHYARVHSHAEGFVTATQSQNGSNSSRKGPEDLFNAARPSPFNGDASQSPAFDPADAALSTTVNPIALSSSPYMSTSRSAGPQTGTAHQTGVYHSPYTSNSHIAYGSGPDLGRSRNGHLAGSPGYLTTESTSSGNGRGHRTEIQAEIAKLEEKKRLALQVVKETNQEIAKTSAEIATLEEAHRLMQRQQRRT